MNKHDEPQIPIAKSAEEAKELAEKLGKAVSWEVKVPTFETEKLVKKLKKKAKLKVIKT